MKSRFPILALLLSAILLACGSPPGSPTGAGGESDGTGGASTTIPWPLPTVQNHTLPVEAGIVVKVFVQGSYAQDAVLVRVIDPTDHPAWLAGAIGGVAGFLVIDAGGLLALESDVLTLGEVAGARGVWEPIHDVTIEPATSYFFLPGTNPTDQILYQGTYYVEPGSYPRGCLGAGPVAKDGTVDLLIAGLKPGNGSSYYAIVPKVPRATKVTGATISKSTTGYRWIQ